MRALELTIFMFLLIATPPLLGAMQIMPISIGTCVPEECGATAFVYDTMNSTSLQQVHLDTSSILSWDTATFALTYVVFGFFWVLFLLSAVVIIGPALMIMFHVPLALAIYISMGQWLIYMIAYIQIKRGGYSLEGYR